MIYVVNKGDYIYKIAKQFAVSMEEIIHDNQLMPPYTLAIGQALFIQTGLSKRDMLIRLNGYAYPFITQEVLEATLPFLTDLSIFSYGFTMEGVLVPPQLDDSWMSACAIEYHLRPLLTLTPLTEKGNFNNNLISSILHNERYQDELIYELVETVQKKHYGGVDIDFEYIVKEDRDAFSQFVKRITGGMNELGFEVSIALVPKISAQHQGL